MEYEEERLDELPPELEPEFDPERLVCSDELLEAVLSVLELDLVKATVIRTMMATPATAAVTIPIIFTQFFGFAVGDGWGKVGDGWGVTG